MKIKLSLLMRRITSFILISCFINFAHSAEFTINSEDMLFINGEFQEGDYKELVSKIARHEVNGGNFLGRRKVIIESFGGSVKEAQLIGQLISDIHAYVTVWKNCYSACFWIIASAPSRNIEALNSVINPKIGIHNVYLDKLNSSQLSANQLANAIREANSEARVSLMKLEIPAYLIDKMVARTSNDIYILTPEDILNVGKYKPSINQVRVSKCNADPILERSLTDFLQGMRSELPQIDKSYFDNVNSCLERLLRRDALDGFMKHASLNRKK